MDKSTKDKHPRKVNHFITALLTMAIVKRTVRIIPFKLYDFLKVPKNWFIRATIYPYLTVKTLKNYEF